MDKLLGGYYEVPSGDKNKLGAGGMGAVFLGVDTRTGQKVAIKQLKQDLIADNTDFVERFSREAEALRRLNHPNIVAVLETIEEDDQHYIIMEYVSGGSLEDLLEDTPILSIERVLEIALDLADALTRAHRQKIIHRDIKPANVLLAEDGTPRLTDFGVAQMDDKTRVTKTGAIVGTLNYISPEALNGKPLDERADIWAFGVMLFEMLTGARPFDDDTTTSLITSILTQIAPDVREKRPDVPPALAILINQMLAKERDQRLDSVRKVGTELENIIRGADSGELDLNSTLVEAVLHEGKSRFAPTTPHPDTHVGSRHGITTMMDEEGKEYLVMPKATAKKGRIIFGTVITVLLLLVIILSGAIKRDSKEEDVQATTNAEATESAISRMPELDPIEDDEYLVLVVSRPSLEGEEPGNVFGVARSVTQTLRDFFERDVPSSNIRIQSYQMPDMSPEDATDEEYSGLQEMQKVLNSTEAAVIVMLETDPEGRVTARVRIGNLELFPYNQFEREALENMVNVDVILDITREETLVPYILGAMSVMHGADGNVFELMRVITMTSSIDLPPAESIGSGLNTYIYDYMVNYLDDTEASVAAMDAALEIDGGNPIFYAYRAMANTRLGDFDTAEFDAKTADRIGPNKWVLPLLFMDESLLIGAAESSIDLAVSLRPDDWFLYAVRAELNYIVGNLDEAQTDIEMSLDLNPQTNTSHVIGVLVALHQGHLADAGTLMVDMVQKYPDPNFGARIFNSVFGEMGSVAGSTYSAVTNLIIGQYNAAIEDTAVVIQMVQSGQVDLLGDAAAEHTVVIGADLFLVRGIAYCSLDDLDSALLAYNTGLALAPDFNMLYLLRAEIYARQGDMEAMNSDIESSLGLSEEFDALVREIVAESSDGAETIDCDEFFEHFMAISEQGN